jgi:hypothetical protein
MAVTCLSQLFPSSKTGQSQSFLDNNHILRIGIILCLPYSSIEWMYMRKLDRVCNMWSGEQCTQVEVWYVVRRFEPRIELMNNQVVEQFIREKEPI